MNIVLINHYAGSPEMGMEFRPYYLAKEWVKQGHRVRILAGDFSHLREHNPEVSREFQHGKIDGIDYYWIKTGKYEGNGIKRAFTMFRFVGKLWLNADKIAEKFKPDVVIASSTYPLDTYAAQKIAKKARAILIHEVHDMWPATLYEIGGMSKWNPFVILMQIAENSAYRHSNYVVSLLPLAKEYMIKHGMKPEHFVYIPNGIIEAEWEKSEIIPQEHECLLRELKRNNQFIIGFFGSHTNSYGLDALLDAAKKLEGDNISFVLVGKGTEKERLEKRKNQENIKNVYFLPQISKKSIPNLLSYFDCIYIGSKASPLFRFGICMNKMFDAMMSGKPIICAITVKETPISIYQCGVMVRSEDVDGIIQAIKQMEGDTEENRYRMGQNGQIAMKEHFTYEKLANQFENIFKEAVNYDER